MGRAAALVAAVILSAAGCTLGNGTSQTASTSPESSPSTASTTTNPVTSTPAATTPSPAATPSSNGLAVTGIPTHNGEVGVGYLAVTVAATGGTPPYTWAATGLPPGLALSPQGVLTGNNTAAGKFNFSVQVTDSTGATATGSNSMTVFPALAVSQPCAQVCNVGIGCTVCGRFGTVTGGAGPYKFQLAGGTVPPGMTLNGFALQGPFPYPLAQQTCNCDVLFAGPPITRIPWNLSASVTDDFGVTKTVVANFSEFFPVTILCTGANPCSCSIGSNVCSGIAAYEFGAPSDNVTVQVTQTCTTSINTVAPVTTCIAGMPPNWSATAKGGVIDLTLDPNNGFTGTVTIDLVDHGACVAPSFVVSRTVDLSVNWPGP